MRVVSERLYKSACEIFPGGVNSPVRAFRNVESTPLFVKNAAGPFLFDADDQKYVDFVLSWGPLVLGHAHPEVVEAIAQQAARGTSYGACCELEILLAQQIQKHFPTMELLRFVNSGTEAGMAVVRLARAFTGKSKIIKFAGCYHGHLDALLVQAGSGATTFSVPSSSGVPNSIVKDTLIAKYNNIDSVRELFQKNENEVAAILIEPAAGNMGFVPASTEFLKHLQSEARAHGALLIFDEVMTGFRAALGGVQAIVDVKPDLTMLGKVIGGGLPVGAFGGRREIMELLSPLGAVYQAGTLSGNPLAMAAGLTTLKLWEKYFSTTAEQTSSFVKKLTMLVNQFDLPWQADSIGTMFGYFFNHEKVCDYETALKSDLAIFKKFFNLSFAAGIYFAPSQFEAGFLSAAHNEELIADVLSKLEKIFPKVLGSND